MVDYNLTWQQPPPTEGGRKSRPEIDAIVAQLQSNPGKWAHIRIVKNPGSSTTTFRKRGVETTLRRRPDNQYDMYARWPEPEPDPF
jgi:nicotinamidase-related amidase